MFREKENLVKGMRQAQQATIQAVQQAAAQDQATESLRDESSHLHLFGLAFTHPPSRSW